MEDGDVTYPDSGTPQGGVISPLLANVFLHEVLDTWFENEVKPRLKGRAFLVRYADNVTAVFSLEEDARRVWAVLPKRFARYGLTLHPEKTRLIAFRRPSGIDRDAAARPTSFDLLGFTHFWTRSLRGSWVIKRKTARDRLSRALWAIAQWCQQHRHAPVSCQHAVLSRKLRGHYGYYGITGNSLAITRFRYEVRSRWRKWLNRRGGRSPMSWPHFIGSRNAIRSPQPSPSTPAIAVQRTHELKSRMRESRTSGSVGAPGGRLPGATRLPLTAGSTAKRQACQLCFRLRRHR